MSKIYIVEDDDNIRELVSYALTQAGFKIEGFGGADGFWPALESSPAPCLIILDIMLPGEDGISILKRIKQSRSHTNIPVIMLTAKGSEYDRIKGLDLGADDYITKPFSVMELISRARAVLRRCGEAEVSTALNVPGLSINPDRRSVVADGREISLTYTEFELLHYMMLNAGVVLSRDRFMERIWGLECSVESRTVDMHVKALRQKLGPRGELIKTVRGVGYKLEAGG
ncbi:DNA-binding response regulator [Clostridia bacterium]|nr:DNA-binding response regulator [Clostridia bacterium]